MESKKNTVLMVGPDMKGLGGISRVVRIWFQNGLFQCYRIKYISSVSDHSPNKINFILIALLRFLNSALRTRIVYVHTSSYNSFRRKSIFLFFGIVFRKKVILHIHPTHFLNYLSGLNKLEKYYVFNLLRRVDIFIVLTKEMKKNIGKFFPKKPIYILPNPVEMDRMVPGNLSNRKKTSLLYLGWFIREKGVYELIDSVKKILENNIDVSLDFFGTKKVEDLKSYIKGCNLEKSIKVHGWVDGDRKLKVLQECSAIILPSHSEGIPNVILEAMATKTPIISTLAGGLAEILIDDVNAIIIRPGDIDDIADKIIKCFGNDNLRNRIVENAYQDAKKKYSIPVIQLLFHKIISDINGQI